MREIYNVNTSYSVKLQRNEQPIAITRFATVVRIRKLVVLNKNNRNKILCIGAMQHISFERKTHLRHTKKRAIIMHAAQYHRSHI